MPDLYQTCTSLASLADFIRLLDAVGAELVGLNDGPKWAGDEPPQPGVFSVHYRHTSRLEFGP